MSKKELRAWETVSRKTILKHSKFLTVENHVVKLPDGKVIPDWPWLIIPSAATVLAVTKGNKFLCFRQIKYAVEGTALAPVGGMLEPCDMFIIKFHTNYATCLAWQTAVRRLLFRPPLLAADLCSLITPVATANRKGCRLRPSRLSKPNLAHCEPNIRQR